MVRVFADIHPRRFWKEFTGLTTFESLVEVFERLFFAVRLIVLGACNLPSRQASVVLGVAQLERLKRAATFIFASFCSAAPCALMNVFQLWCDKRHGGPEKKWS